jgi:disulfide bond formation protein DsbB
MPVAPFIDVLADSRTRAAPILIAAASIAALTAALVGEHVFHIVGCTLCQYQRVPYGATTAVAIIALVLRPSPERRRTLIAACAVLFAAGCAIALYQAGMQQGWWDQPGVCEAALPNADALIDLRSARPARPACKDIDWSLFGLSLATLNALYSGALAAGCFALLWYRPAPPPPTRHGIER